MKSLKPLWEQMDDIHIKFHGAIEPWTIVRCTTCKAKYHLVDGATCECGKEESKQRQKKYIGDLDNGFV